MSNREALRGMYEAHQKAKAMTTPQADPARRAPEDKPIDRERLYNALITAWEAPAQIGHPLLGIDGVLSDLTAQGMVVVRREDLAILRAACWCGDDSPHPCDENEKAAVARIDAALTAGQEPSGKDDGQ